jgi:DNA-3-methyladenine glycosylase I
VRNAKAFLEVQAAFGGFDAYVWQFTDGRTIQHRCRRDSDIPATSKESDAMSREMKARGFSFVGSTICYAYMQACGMVNDHLVRCTRHAQLRS